MIEDTPSNQGPAKLSSVVRLSRVPVAGWVVLSCSGTIILQSLHGVQLVPALFFSGLMLLHASLLWHSEQLTAKQPWLYFLIQACLINGAAFLMPDGAPVNLVGLNPVMIGLCLIVYQRKRPVLLFFAVYYFSFCYSAAYVGGGHLVALLFPLFLLMTIVVTVVTRLIMRQFREQLRIQTFLAELEIAHLRVEELTIANERQRMARDLHDTLAQGLAGLIMQLEAVDAHLGANNAKRAREIVHQSMQRARRTLAEARQVIDDLRAISAPNADFDQAVTEEAKRFCDETGIRVHLELNAGASLSKLLTEHFLHIVRECLANIARHAGADEAWIQMSRNDAAIRMRFAITGKASIPGSSASTRGTMDCWAFASASALSAASSKSTAASQARPFASKLRFRKE